MSKYLGEQLNINLPDSFVETWTNFLGECSLEGNSHLKDIIANLSSKYSLTIATNWFYSQQIRKLERLEILPYFDEIVTADKFKKKPYLEMYKYLLNGYQKNEVIVVGDSFETDIRPAINLGMNGYLINNDNTYNNSINYSNCTTISSINDLEKYL